MKINQTKNLPHTHEKQLIQQKENAHSGNNIFKHTTGKGLGSKPYEGHKYLFLKKNDYTIFKMCKRPKKAHHETRQTASRQQHAWWF